MRTIAEKLFGRSYERSVLAAGRHQGAIHPQAALLGGDLRVCLEDSLYIEEVQRGASAQDRSIVEHLGRTVATPDEARQRLGLKGADKVAF